MTRDEDYADDLVPTDEERRAINTLKRLARRWPDSLYLYSAAGSLCVMRKEPDGSVTFVGIEPGTEGTEFVVAPREGRRTLVVRDGQHEYAFVEVADAAAR